MSTSRRSVIKSIASVAVAAPLGAQHVHPTANEFVQISAASGIYKPKFFTEKQLEMVRMLVDLIIPRTDTPGAADAGVHRFIDTDVSRRPDMQKRWTEAIVWLDGEANRVGGKPFSALTPEQQIGILAAASASIDAPGWNAFTLAKSFTVDGYYGTREGLQTELGWNANTFLAEFKGCTHKEHQG